ncbi:hypothetical protein [Paenibacillus senegalimassiliensis]|uniref:hypothetical protein n=1 Tax=Paenibacillus senegalimassiliensis TaxID=1737426 RepID=UPI00073EE103|nr:hypothetical protein [Paenibacillus senegalimassiliensis]
MLITRDYVKQLGACSEGFRYFLENFPEGATYQDVLNKCYEDGHADWANWLMDSVSDAEMSAANSTQTKVGVVFGIPGFVKATIDFLWNRTWFDPTTVEPSEGDSQGNHAQLASSGDGARLASSGYGAQLASSGCPARQQRLRCPARQQR